MAPAELRPTLTASQEHPFTVFKKNYLGVESSYSLDYFQHSAKNLNLADINNHITAEYLAVTGDEGGLAVAADTTVLANFAFCPLKMAYDPGEKLFRLRLNPFGAYFGPQYAQPTWGSGLGYTMALAAGGQYHSSAPSFNAVSQSFSLMLAFFPGNHPPASIKHDLAVFAHPPEAVTGGWIENSRLSRSPRKRVTAPLQVAAASDDRQVFFNWSRSAGPVKSYKVYCGPVGEAFNRVWSTHHGSLETDQLTRGTRYHAVVTAVGPDCLEGPQSAEIEFTPGDWPAPAPPTLPAFLQLRLMTAGLASLVR